MTFDCGCGGGGEEAEGEGEASRRRGRMTTRFFMLTKLSGLFDTDTHGKRQSYANDASVPKAGRTTPLEPRVVM